MTPTQLYNFVNSLLGLTLDPTEFNSLIAVAQMNREISRDWVILRKKDLTKTWTPADTYLTQKALPTGFLRYVNEDPIKLLDSATPPNLIGALNEVPFDSQYEHKDDPGVFYVDHAQSMFSVCGKTSVQRTLAQFYLYKPSDVTYDSTGGGGDVAWAFPTWALPILGYDAAAMHRLGADYDNLNARMGEDNDKRAQIIYASMCRWDARLALNTTRNTDISPADRGGFTPGRIDING